MITTLLETKRYRVEKDDHTYILTNLTSGARHVLEPEDGDSMAGTLGAFGGIAIDSEPAQRAAKRLGVRPMQFSESDKDTVLEMIEERINEAASALVP